MGNGSIGQGLPAIGQHVEVTLGTKRVSVEVTQANQQMLADGDLTNDLDAIRGKDGNAATLTTEDFKAAGFASNQLNFLANVGRGVKTFTLGSAQLDPKDQQNFQTLVASKTYLGPNASTPATPQFLNGRLKHMPVMGRNGVLSELAMGTAMMRKRDAALESLRTMTVAGKPFNMLGALNATRSMSTVGAATTNGILQRMGGINDDNRQILVDAILKHPDMPLANKHELLNALGITNIFDRNKLIGGARTEAMTDIEADAKALFKTLGGTGEMGKSIMNGTGDGTGTKGLAGIDNCAIAYMQYGDPTSFQGRIGLNGAATVGGIGSRTETYAPLDLSKPVVMHVSASNSDAAGNTLTVKRGKSTYTFEVKPNANGITEITPARGSVLPPGVTYDRTSQTLTFPPGAEPITVTASSGTDEVEMDVTMFNVTGAKPNIALDFGKLFASDRFSIDWNNLTADQQQQIDTAAKWMAEHPDEKLTIDIQGQGPVDFDGSLAPEIGKYGEDGSGTSRAEMELLRSSQLNVDFDAHTATVVSTTDPVVSGLNGSKVGDDGKAPLTVDGRKALNKFMAANPKLTLNDALAGLRGFAVVALLRQRVEAFGGNPGQISVGKATVDKDAAFSEATFKAISQGTMVLTNVPQP